MRTNMNLDISGRFVIRNITDPGNPIVLADEPNTVHTGNMAKHLAFALAGHENHSIYAMTFGLGEVSFENRKPNTNSVYSNSDTVNNIKYGSVVNQVDDASNFVIAANQPGNNYTDVITTCTIPSTPMDLYYDEVGILSYPENPEDENELVKPFEVNGETKMLPAGILLVHKIFQSEIRKRASDVHEVVHTLRIRM